MHIFSMANFRFEAKTDAHLSRQTQAMYRRGYGFVNLVNL